MSQQSEPPNVLRVAHVCLELAHGGLERCVLEWTRQRNSVVPGSTYVVCLDAPGPLASELPPDCIVSLDADRSRRPWDDRAVRALRKFLISDHIKVVHSHNLAAQQYTGLATRGSFKHIHTEHGTNPHLCGLRNRLRLAWLRRSTDAWVAVSTHTVAAMREGTGIDFRCVNNGIDPTPRGMQAQAARVELGLPAEGAIIGIVGRLSHEKGVDRLIAALAELPCDLTPHLAIVGDGPQRSDLERQVLELDLDCVHFYGARSDARDLMRAFDLLVLPSRSEGLPMVLLEAMAEGVPVLVAPVGHCPELVADGCGDLLPAAPDAWPALLQALVEQARRGELAASVAAARTKVATSYSLKDTVARYEAIYCEVLSC